MRADDAERRVLERRRLRQPAQMIEHDRRRQAFEQRRRSRRSGRARMWICTCQPRSATRFASGSIMSIDTAAERGSNTVKRMPRMPPSASVFSSASVTVGCTTATPRAFAARAARCASSVTRLSVHVGGGRARSRCAWCRCAAAAADTARRRHSLHARLRARPRGRKALAVVDVHVAVAGVRRRLELRRFGAAGVRHVLRERRCSPAAIAALALPEMSDARRACVASLWRSSPAAGPLYSKARRRMPPDGLAA